MSITDDQAQRVIDAVIAKSEELGYAITVAVVDSAGEVTAVRRMDGVGPINFDFAYSCAYNVGDHLPERRGARLGQGHELVARGERHAGWPAHGGQGARCRCATETR